MNRIFDNQIVLISGGLGDIGKAIARSFAARGASIALGDLKPEQDADMLLAELHSHGVRTHYQMLDVSSAKQVADWIGSVENNLGLPGIVIANAATVTIASVEKINSEQWASEIDINLNGSFYVTKMTAERWIEKGLAGRILFIGSWAAHAVHPNLPAYCVSKAAVRMLCKCMALELAPHQILVNELAPGYVEAGLSATIWKINPELSQQAKERVPVKKLITADEVAAQALYLCDPQNVHMTGSTVLMDGGLSLLS